MDALPIFAPRARAGFGVKAWKLLVNHTGPSGLAASFEGTFTSASPSSTISSPTVQMQRSHA
jgi:hypothetical protein